MRTKEPAAATPDRPLANSYWVIPRQLLAGEHPAAADPGKTAERLRRLREAGITCYFDLTEDGEQPDYRHLLAAGDVYRRSPIVDAGVPYNLVEMQKLLAMIRAALVRGRGVYVHCRVGIGRTGLVMGCFLAEHGGRKSALATLNALWPQSTRSLTWPKLPQTAEQADYIRHWPRLSKLVTKLPGDRMPGHGLKTGARTSRWMP